MTEPIPRVFTTRLLSPGERLSTAGWCYEDGKRRMAFAEGTPQTILNYASDLLALYDKCAGMEQKLEEWSDLTRKETV